MQTLLALACFAYIVLHTIPKEDNHKNTIDGSLWFQPDHSSFSGYGPAGKDVEGHANYFYECNDIIHEKNINKAIDTFVKQLKDSKEAHRKEINSLQLKEEKLEKEKSQKFEDNNSQQKMANGKSEHSTIK